MLKTESRLVAHDGIPLRLAHLAESHVFGDAGVVDEDVDRAGFGGHFAGAGLARVKIRHVARVGIEAVTPLFHGTQPFLRRLVGRGISDRDLVAGVRHLGADGLAKTTHATGNNRYALGHFLTPSSWLFIERFKFY
jgi:hypothetical protein